MSSCQNCFLPIADARQAKHCKVCFKPVHPECAINEDGGVFCDVCYVAKGDIGAGITFELPEEIRRTYIELYRTCPFKFLEVVINGMEDPATIYTQLGIDLHDWFDRSAHDPSIDADHIKGYMRKTFATKLYQDLLAEHDDARFWERCETSIDTYFHIKKSLPTTPFITEELIRFSIGEDLPLVRFTMDRIDEVDGELELLDWKTGKVMVGQKLSTDLQAPLYILGTIKHFNRPVRKFTFYYVNENKERVFTRSATDPDIYECYVGKRVYKVSLQDTVRELQSVFTQIKKGNFNIPQDTRKLYFHCKNCIVKENGKCAGADEQSWHNKSNGGW